MAYKKLLVPLDGSPLAEKALPYATYIAKKHGSEIFLLSIGSAPGSERITALSRAYLELKAEKLKVEGIKTTTEIVYGGGVADRIVEYAEKNDVDMIAICTHGYSGFKRLMLGSVAEKVIGSTNCPVLMIRPGSREEVIGLGRILLPLDGSFFSEAAVPYAAEMALGTGATITLLAVTEVPNVPSDRSPDIKPSWEEYREALTQEAKQQAEVYLNRVKAEIEKKKVKVVCQVVVGDISGGICDVADCQNVDMVVMATHGRTGVSRLVFGSVARRIADESCQPVLLVRPEEDRTGGPLKNADS